MTLPFGEFVQAYNDGSITDDAAWRAYDIESMATEQKSRDALKQLGFLRIDFSIALEQVRRDYSISTRLRTAMLLKFWRTWAQIANGERRGKLLKRETEND
jgi:hypothetical protein